MKIKNMIYLLGIGTLSLLLISSCNYTKNVILLSRGSVQQTNFLESIDFENRHGLIVVKGFVNGNDDTLEFLFDTGAFDGKITRFWGDKYNLKEKATKNKSDSQGNENEISMTLIKELSLGYYQFQKYGSWYNRLPSKFLISMYCG